MTIKEAKIILESYIACESKKAHFECNEINCDDNCPLLYGMGTAGEYNEAINIAIHVLSQENINTYILDYIMEDIKAEKEMAYADFDQYKVDYLGIDADYVEDELPNDEFRYGMERCLEIINKHMKEGV